MLWTPRSESEPLILGQGEGYRATAQDEYQRWPAQSETCNQSVCCRCRMRKYLHANYEYFCDKGQDCCYPNGDQNATDSNWERRIQSLALTFTAICQAQAKAAYQSKCQKKVNTCGNEKGTDWEVTVHRNRRRIQNVWAHAGYTSACRSAVTASFVKFRAGGAVLAARARNTSGVYRVVYVAAPQRFFAKE